MNNEELRGLLHTSKEELDDAVRTIGNFQKGTLKPLKTSMDHLNNACLGGLIPGNIISIGARPQNGKTYTLHRLKNDILESDMNVKMLLYNWEMPWFSLILIQLKKFLKKSFKEILLNVPTEVEKDVYKEVMTKFRDERLTTISKALNPQDWYELTRMYILENLSADLIIVAIDHIGITVGDDKMKTQYKLMELQNSLKLEFPSKVCFINLCQLKREIELLWRSKDTNPTGLRVSSEFLLGSDALNQYSDVIMAQVIPERANMEQYASVNRKRYEHLKEHFVEDTNPTSDYIRLKGTNRVFFDYIKKRMPDEEDSTLYCELLNPEIKDFVDATSNLEKDYIKDDNELDF